MADQRGQIVREEFIESFQSEFPSLTSYLKEVSEEKDSLRITRLESVIQELRRETDSYRKLLIQAREEIVARDDEIIKLGTEYQQKLEQSYTEFDYKCDQYNSLHSQFLTLQDEREKLSSKVVIKQENEYFQVAPSDRTGELDKERNKAMDLQERVQEEV